MQAHPFTQNALFACAAALALAAPAHADIFSWTDATGRLNISNVAPPQDVHARRIVQEDPRKPVVAPPSAEVEALKERVAELESEVDRAKQSSAAPPPPIIVAPQVVVAPQPAPAVAYAPPAAYAPPDIAPCDPLTFGCPAFGYPWGVVVVSTPRFHRFHRGHDGVRRASVVPAHPTFGAVPARPGFGMHRR